MNQVVQLACARGPEGTLRVALGGEWKLARGVPAPRLVIQEIERSPLPRRVIFETGVLAGWAPGRIEGSPGAGLLDPRGGDQPWVGKRGRR